jgi:DNA (cytosine-5)-methyltransferase 1
VRFGSVCSGIEAASVAWHPLGWKAAWFSEIELFPSAVLAHHYPNVPNLGDMTMLPDRILSDEIEAPDILCGGTPCQAFSVAGLRKSLDDARGNLSLTFCEIANAIDSTRNIHGKHPAIIFWENVPGVLNTKDNAFGCFLGELAGENSELQPAGGKWSNAGCVFGPKRAVAWRVLDAQYFGLAQRRKRVFVVASARNDFDPASILFEFDGLRRDTAPSRETGKEVTELAGTLAANGGGLNRPAGNANELDFCVVGTIGARTCRSIGAQDADCGHLLPVPFDKQRIGEYSDNDIASTCAARDYKDATDLVVHGTQDPCVSDVAFALGRNSGQENVVAFGGDIARTLQARHDSSPCADRGMDVIATNMQVRRLTPTECERLQGFPDSYTKIPWRNKPSEACPDGPRYKALGNSWAVPVVRWIGKRISLSLELRKSQ